LGRGEGKGERRETRCWAATLAGLGRGREGGVFLFLFLFFCFVLFCFVFLFQSHFETFSKAFKFSLKFGKNDSSQNQMHRHVITEMFLHPMLSFSFIKKNIIFPIFHEHKIS